MYRCIHCLTPSDALYRKYGSSTIKLSQCSNCQRDVDPYCEREWLLVVLDCILLREEAYRHVLFHRRAELTSGQLRTAFVLSSLFRAHLGMCQTAEYDYAKFAMRVIESGVFLFMTTGFLWALLYLQSRPARGKATRTALTGKNDSTISYPLTTTLVYLAVILPTLLCHAATLGVQIWEFSDTVRQLGSLLMLVYQWMGLVAVCHNKVRVTWSMAATLALRAALMSTIPCPGLLWQYGEATYCFA